ncbi:MAG: hypothetical protein PWP49_1692 [Thermococcaceae archaeon]|jgi:hypothetical protein|uniref:hypothetical protein n=2 Tax=Thermococcus TaxID=2263 RepID=UPI00128BD3E4|nr:hypothetical protein [Thermococcus sp. 101 C5]MDK2784001.1 hypothetical protein [Thermococcaceae archaeon]MDN5321272.1 hypothetical protein [Thermococcaceae archaeon]MPW39954.1 hypothetical protein [Thermococcus sp. 101 C5]
MSKVKQNLYEIFGEVIAEHDFIKAFLITSALAFLMYFSAPQIVRMIGREDLLNALRVTLGAFGAFLGFIVSTATIEPKRVVEEE